MKEKLAATMINHWYCVNRSQQLINEELARNPTADVGLSKPQPDKYKAKLLDIYTDTSVAAGKELVLDPEKIRKHDEHFSRLNRRIFNSIADKLVRTSGIERAKLAENGQTNDITVCLGAPVKKKKDFEAHIKALNHELQIEQILDLMLRPPKLDAVDDASNLLPQYSLGCGTFNFYKDYYVVEQELVQLMHKHRRLCAIIELINTRLSLLPDDKAEFDRNRIHIYIDRLEWGTASENEDCVIKTLEMRIQETPDVKIERAMKIRLEEEFRKSVRAVKSIEDKGSAAIIQFEDPAVPMVSVDLDILTNW